MKNKKIIFDCERMKYPHTGLYHFCLQLGRALQVKSVNYSHEVGLYIPENAKQEFDLPCPKIIQYSYHKLILPSTKGYEVWHSTYQGTRYFPGKRKIKKVLTIHDLNFLYNENKTDFKKKKELKRLQDKIDQSDVVVAISNFVLSDIKAHLNIDHRNSYVIYNGCNINNKEDSIFSHPEQNRPFLYTIGTITEKKNFHVLPALLKRFDGDLIISGIVQSVEYKAKIISMAKHFGVEDRLKFTGPVTENEKKWYLSNCEAFVFPSLAEGFGLPVVEAMHFGKPMILSKLTSLPEIGGDDAFYFENFDAEGMQDVLEKCLNDKNNPTLTDRLKTRAASFNWEKAAASYHEIYKNL